MNRVIAIYLPQFHPIPENDKWYGKGFTEWRDVAQARPLFHGHYQPHIPADLGFYDLRLIDTIREQAKMAKEYCIEGFCFWHYWFGEKKQLLEKPFQMLVNDKSIDIGFSLAWANEDWYKKKFGKNELLMKQKYGGVEDYTAHFYEMLPAFKDKRYTRIEGRLLFIIYNPFGFKDISTFMETWQNLARKENIGQFFFVAHDFACRNKENLLKEGYDAVYDDNVINIHHQLNTVKKIRLKIERDYLNRPTVFDYKEAVKAMIIDGDYENDVFPMISPNWDNSPRYGGKGFVFKNCDPKEFKVAVKNACDAVKGKPAERQLFFVRAWNEWGEGNHLEPDLKYGKGYLEVLRDVIEEK